MELKAVVKYRGALAHYNIYPENETIYQARLIRYDGRPDQTPAKQIILEKTPGHWAGGGDKQDLIDKIGEVIERRMTSYNSLFSEKNMDGQSGLNKSG